MSKQRGQILLITIMLLATVLTVVLAVTFKSTTETQLTKLEEESQKALSAAEAGVEAALQKSIGEVQPIASLPNFAGTGFTGEARVEAITDSEFASPLLSKDQEYTFYLADYLSDTHGFANPMDGSVQLYFNSESSCPALELTFLDGIPTGEGPPPTLTPTPTPAGPTSTPTRTPTPTPTPITTGDTYCPPGNSETNCASGKDPTPLTHWKMDEASWVNNCSTGTVIDSTGNANHAMSCPSGSGPTTPVAGKIGTAANFDGTNDYLEVNQSWKNGLGSFSVSFWIYVNSLNGLSERQYRVFQKLNGEPNYPRMDISGNGGISVQMRVGGNTDNATAPGGTIKAGVWQHVAIAYDATAHTTKIYVNAVPISTYNNSTGTLDGGSNNMRLGYVGSNEYFSGKLDDFRVYNYVRTASQVAWDYSQP